MTEPVPIRPGVAAAQQTSEPNALAVAELEDLLARARSGEIVGIAYVTQHPGDMTAFNYAGRITRSAFGALRLLEFRMCKADLEDR